MQWLPSFLLAVQVVSSLSVILLVLLQQGKGADMGSSFGGGSAGSLFGASGAANFLSRMTKYAAILFFATTAGLAWFAHHPSGSPLDGGVMKGFSGAPAQPATGTGPDVPTVPGTPPGTATDVPAVPNSAPAAPAASSDVPVAPRAAEPAPAAPAPAPLAPEPAAEPETAPAAQTAPATEPAPAAQPAPTAPVEQSN